MTLRQRFKYWLYGKCPGFAGAFPYHGVSVHFPARSLIFEIACAQGIYEAANLRVLLSALKPGTLAIDVGANIGLMSVPLLAADPSVQVLSLEPSPNTFACLQRTAAGSPYHDRWICAAQAVGDREGSVDFYYAAAALAIYDGVKDTQRGGSTNKVTVPVTTIDKLWTDRGRPPVSVIKIDVEGADAAVVRGGQACIRAHRPLILLEWNADNLRSHACPVETLLQLAGEINYAVYAMPALTPVASADHLRALMRFDESFVLLPIG